MALSSTHLSSILQKMAVVKSGDFTKSDIEALLMAIRFDVNSKSLTKELADFIGHQGEGRDRGVFHDELNWRSSIMKLGYDNSYGVNGYGVNGPIDLLTMSKKFYHLFFKTAVSKFNNAQWTRALGINQRDINQLVQKAYVLNDEKTEYRLTDIRLVPQLMEVIQFALSQFTSKNITTIEAIVLDLDREINKLLKNHKQYVGAINEHATYVSLCILCLIQNMGFTLYDGTHGQLILTSSDPDPLMKPASAGKVLVMHGQFYVGKHWVRSAFIGSSLSASTYLDSSWNEESVDNDEEKVAFVKKDETGAPKLYKYSFS